MKKKKITFAAEWSVIRGSRRSQAATMVIAPGKAEGGPQNRHSGDQWLYVVRGRGTAIINGKKHTLAPGWLLFIKAGERHEIRNTGSSGLRTINFYSPPQY